MPEENQTWETASAEPAPLDAPSVPEPAPEIAAETSTLETTVPPQLDAETEPVRESESTEQIVKPETPSEVKDELADDDPPELANITSISQRQWSKRQFQEAKPIRDFTNYEKPITEFADDLYARSPSRYTEHVKDLVSRHAQELFGMSLDDLTTRLQNGQPAPTPPAAADAPATDASLLTVDQLDQMSNDQVFQTIQEIRTAEQKKAEALEQKVNDLQQQFEAVNGKFTSQEEQARQGRIAEKQNDMLERVMKVVDDGIRDSGLEVKPDDPPKIASLKRAASRLLDRNHVSELFDSSEENKKLVKNVVDAINRGEFQNADREEDNLKVRARAAFVQAKDNEDVKAILEQIEEYASQSKGNSRGANPVPPGGGSSVGISIKPPSTWDEAEGRVATA